MRNYAIWHKITQGANKSGARSPSVCYSAATRMDAGAW
jgi:hypothetical protein